MVLSDRDLKKAIKSGRIKITPPADLKTQLGPCSIDLRLGNTFLIFEHSKYPFIDPLNPKNDQVTKKIITRKNEPFVVQPGDFILASTYESIEIADDLVGQLEGRSSIGRMGIVVHSTAALFNPGWRGKAVLELGNMGRIAVALYPGMRICSMTFSELTSPAETPYYKSKSAKYKDQKGPGETKIHEER